MGECKRKRLGTGAVIKHKGWGSIAAFLGAVCMGLVITVMALAR